MSSKRKARYEILEESGESEKYCAIRPSNCDGSCEYAECFLKEKRGT